MKNGLPRVWALDGDLLAQVKSRIGVGDYTFDAPLAKLKQQADAALAQGPWSPVDKPTTPPSGDKHDYMSLGRYYWPNPDTQDGLPYVSRDGKVNPEILTIPDHQNLDTLMDNVLTLALAFYFTGTEPYAEHAARVMRVWFLDDSTRMNPNLKFCQGIRGLNAGRNAGIIETRELTQVVDAMGLLAGSKAWTGNDQWGMERWFTRFLDWLVYDSMAQLEANQENNHGTFYDAQVIALALFLGETRLAERFAAKAPGRIARQIAPDGRQPLELARTLAWHYTVFNLQALFRLASLAEHLGVDLWDYATNDGRSLRRAVEFTLPYVCGKTWDYPQIGPQDFKVLFGLLCQASVKYQDAKYYGVAVKCPGVDTASHRSRLLLNLPSEARR